MSKILIATIKEWNIENCRKLWERFPDHEIKMITDRRELTYDLTESYHPDFIFFPHWSWIIPEDIYSNFNCVVFHMTDLPFGRGGSPLQNLLVRGIYHTMISAIKVDSGVDTGAVYLKEPLDISAGSAGEILKRVSDIVFEHMIPRFLTERIKPVEQKGRPTVFKRRKPEQSELPAGLSQRQIYDYIRMLDGEGYPTAYKIVKGEKIYFTKARFENGVTYAEARFQEGEFV